MPPMNNVNLNIKYRNIDVYTVFIYFSNIFMLKKYKKILRQKKISIRNQKKKL